MYQELTFVNKAGFTGFKKVSDLWTDLSAVPAQKGVYLVLQPTDTPPVFLPKGVGGFHKQRDPNIPVSDLSRRWIDACKLLYIGKAGGNTAKATLRSRLKQYLDFGKGKPVGHYGGRLIWQLQRHSELLVAWKVTLQSDPRAEEQQLIREFEAHYGRLPFANLLH